MRAFILLLILYPLLTQADIYRWVDEQGNVHYGDRPAHDTDAEALELEERSVNTDIGEDRQEYRDRLLEAMQEDREAIRDERQRQAAEKRERAARCASLKERYRRIRGASGIYRTDKDGQRNYMSADKRAQYEQRHRELMRRYCS